MRQLRLGQTSFIHRESAVRAQVKVRTTDGEQVHYLWQDLEKIIDKCRAGSKMNKALAERYLRSPRCSATEDHAVNTIEDRAVAL